MQAFVNGIGILGPGLHGWEHACPILEGRKPYVVEAPPEPQPTMLPANELRRSSQVVRWALTVGQEAMVQSQTKSSEVATVFASSEGESGIWHRLCATLASPARVVSPTLFHHSVHNAAAGYWSIGTNSTIPSTSLAGYDSTFCVGLLEAVTQVMVEGRPVLLVVYDLQPSPPILAVRPITAGFSLAMVVGEGPSPSCLAGLEVTLGHPPCPEETHMDEPELERLRIGNPAARALSLLSAIARGTDSTVRLKYLEDKELIVKVTPCPPCQKEN